MSFALAHRTGCIVILHTVRVLALGLLLSACQPSASTPQLAAAPTEAPPPPLPKASAHAAPVHCYSQTDSRNNGCYICHQSYRDKRPHRGNDGFLQGQYRFSEPHQRNPWRNVFIDRRERIAQLSDASILAYVQQDNYSHWLQQNRQRVTRQRLPSPGQLQLGAAAFDRHGLALDGSRWVAFHFKPMPGISWPSNGVTSDVMIRLPAIFAEQGGQFSKDLYFANLALLELAINGGERIASIALNEAALDLDLDGDQVLSTAAHSVERRSHYLGDAAAIALSPMLYPQGTAFMQTLRYLTLDAQGRVITAPRMKEVRFMEKTQFYPPSSLRTRYYQQAKSRHLGRPADPPRTNEPRINTPFGWQLWGFIEDSSGRLRAQTPAEQAYCRGCHQKLGTSIDHSFAFARKVWGRAGWGYRNWQLMRDVPNRGENQGEYFNYLARNPAAQNREIRARWYDSAGRLRREQLQTLASIRALIMPSPERALALNKAYKTLVDEQSFIWGRQALLEPAGHILERIDGDARNAASTAHYHWDIRLDWSEQVAAGEQLSRLF